MTGKLASAAMLLLCAAATAGAQDFDFVGYTRLHKDTLTARRPKQPVLPLGADIIVPVDADVPADVKKQLGEDLNFIKTITGSSASELHKRVFGADALVDGGAYYGFFVSRVKAIGLDDCGNGAAVACVIPFLDSSKMWITQNYIKFSHPQIARLMVLFHESRHTEDEHGNWRHASCPTPFQDEQGHNYASIWTGSSLAGQPACDTSTLGSYGSSTIMLKNIAKFCTNCTEKVRQDAALYSGDQLNRMLDNAKESIRKDVF
ncbi:MAG: hypothetical protein PHP45_09540 [Elusimicrobiales bacterium]|nr:hypothetical protein [Elusimicrobiales bacterium]